MFVQQERINAFYIHLREDAERYHQRYSYLKHFDQDFIVQRKESDDLSVSYWRETIAKRMDFDIISFDNESPFYSFFVNRAWLYLAYDIAKIISNNYFEYRNNWLRILYPKLKLGFSEQRADEPTNYLSPTLLTPSIGCGSVKLYLANSLPNFTTAYQIKNSGSSEVNQRMLHEYYSGLGESYFYIIPTRELFYVFADCENERIYITRDRVHQFHNALFTLLGIKVNITRAPKEMQKRVYTLFVKSLEKLIVENGGYPNLDLRKYYPNEDKTQIYTDKSFFRPRELALEHEYLANKLLVIKKTYNTYGVKYKDFTNYKDLLPHLIYDDPRSYKPRPLSLVEFVFFRYKYNFIPFSDGEENFTLSRRLLVKVFQYKWSEMRIDISRDIITSLIEPILCYYKSDKSLGAFAKLKLDLNYWSKSVKTINYKPVATMYAKDLRKHLTLSQYENLFRRVESSDTKPLWHLDGIRELYKLYSLLVERDNYKYEKYNFLNVLIHIIQKLTPREIEQDVDAVAGHCLRNHPDKIIKFKDFNTRLISAYRNGRLGFHELLRTLMALKATSSPEGIKDIDYIHSNLMQTDILKPITQRILNIFKRLFTRYDNEVKNHLYDHTQEQSEDRLHWQKLAKILTGMGYFPDYLELLCPTLITYDDKVTGKKLSDFDLRHMIFSTCRRYLINLIHTRNLFHVTKKAFDCNGTQLRHLSAYEIEKIKLAAPVYKNFYKELKSLGILESAIPFRILLGLYRLVNHTNYYIVDSTRKYQFVLLSSDTDYSDFSSSILTQAYNYMTGTLVIKIKKFADGLEYFINAPSSQDENVTGKIYTWEFVCPSDVNELDSDVDENLQAQIVHILRKKEILPSEYSKENEEVIDREYEYFRSAVESLPAIQKSCLLGTVIYLENKVVYFGDIYNQARFNIKFANKYFLTMLAEFYPGFDFNYKLRREYYKSFSLPRGEKPRHMADPNIDLNKILISFMTYKFIPIKSMPTNIYHCSFMDIHMKLPGHTALLKIFDSLKTKYLFLEDADQINEYLRDFYNDLITLGIDMYFNGTQLTRKGYYIACWRWFESLINGSMFANLSVLEVHEIQNILQPIKEYTFVFSKNVSVILNELFLKHIFKDISSVRSVHVACNILFIKAMTNMTVDEFIYFFKCIQPNISVVDAHKVLKLFVISQNKMYPSDLQLVDILKEMFDIKIEERNRTSSFLFESAEQIKPGYIHAQILKLPSTLDSPIEKSSQQFEEASDNNIWF